MKRIILLVAALACSAGSEPPRVEVRTGDVALFYRLYDGAGGTPGAETLQRDYIDAGSEGVRQFVPHRIVSGEHLAEQVAHDRAVYANARTCLAALPEVKRRLRGAFARLAWLDPEATFPPVTFLVGANNSGGTTGKSGVLIGLEVMCRASWMQRDPADRLYHIVMHEYGHVEQAAALDDDSHTTVLRQSLIEGGAELVAALTSGSPSNAHLQRWAGPRAAAIDARFLADADSTELDPWLYNGEGTPEQPGDLGYWIGYRIVRAYYDRARDKRAALHDILTLDDPHAVLARSGWRPGD